VPRLLTANFRQQNPTGFATVVVLAVLVTAWLAQWAGMSMAMGAFVLGLLLSGSQFQPHIESIAEYWKELLLALFFIAVGINMDLAVLYRQGVIVLVLVLGISLIKPAVLLLLCLLFRKRLATSVRTALLCAQCGEFVFVVIALSQRLGIMAEENASLGVLTVSITMALTPVLAKLADRWGRRLEAAEGETKRSEPLTQTTGPAVIVGGFGRCSEALCDLLRERDVPFVALDTNWDRVASGRQRGYPVSGGDMTEYHVLKNLGAAEARLFVIAGSNAEVAQRAILAFRLVGSPGASVLVCVKDHAQGDKLRAIGATHLVVENEEIGQRLADSARLLLQIAPDEGPLPRPVEAAVQSKE